MAVVTDLVAKLSLNTVAFQEGLMKSEANVRSFSENAVSSFKKVVAALAIGYVVRELGRELTVTTNRISELVHSASRLGVGVGGLESLRYAANLSGVSTGQLNTSLKFLEKNIGAVELGTSGSKKVAQYFDTLGLSAENLKNMSVDKQFIAISDAIKQIQDPAEQANIAMGLLGRGGLASLGLLKGNIRDTIAEFKGLGIELTTKQANAVEKYGENVKKLDTIWEGFKNQLTAGLAGPLTDTLVWIEKFIKHSGGMKEIAQSAALAIVHGFEKTLHVFSKMADYLTQIKISMIEVAVLEAKANLAGEESKRKVFGWAHSDKVNKQEDENIAKYKAEIKEGQNQINNLYSTLGTSSTERSLMSLADKIKGHFKASGITDEGTMTINGKLVNDMASGTGTINGKSIDSGMGNTINGKSITDDLQSGILYKNGKKVDSDLTPTTIHISLDNGLVAKIASSPENKHVIVTTVHNTLNNAARGS